MEMLTEAIFSWDIVNWSGALPFWSKFIPVDLTGLTALELGAHQGGLSLWMALRNAEVICSDIRNPIAAAQGLHEKWAPNARIHYETIDASRIPYENAFDLIVFKSMLGAIPRNGEGSEKTKVIHEIYKALKPGGILLFAENLEGSSIHRYLRTHFVAWGRNWSYTTLPEIRELLSNFQILDLKTAGFLGAFGRTNLQRNYLGVLDQWVFNAMAGQCNHYIVFGAAQKN